jgi:hypothetical protein
MSKICIIWDQDSPGRSKTYFHFFLLHLSYVNSNSYIKGIPQEEFETYGTVYIPH